MAKRKKVNGNGGSKLTAIYTGDTKNYNKFLITTEGHVGSIYFPIQKDIASKEVAVRLVTPSDSDWDEMMEELIENTDNPKALANLKATLKKHS